MNIAQIPSISVNVPKGTSLQAALQKYVTENKDKEGAVTFVGLDGTFITQINDIAANSASGEGNAFATLLQKFGIQNSIAEFQYAGWMYSGEGLSGLGIVSDTVTRNTTVNFRYTLYYAARTSAEWANYDWEFVDCRV